MTKPRSSNRHAAPARYPRTARINELLREIIATELEKHYDEDTRLELVTITDVETDTGLEHAKVYFSALSSSATEKEIIAALNERRVEFQFLIGRSVKMKRTPLLAFIPDRSLVEGQKIESILRNIEAGYEVSGRGSSGPSGAVEKPPRAN